MGKHGVIKSVVSGLRTCEDSYQVQISGTRCLQNMIQAHPPNAHAAVADGAIPLLEQALARYPEDGQLQWRANMLLGTLRSAAADLDAAAAAADGSPATPFGGSQTLGGSSREEGGSVDSFEAVGAQLLRGPSGSGAFAGGSWERLRLAVSKGHARVLSTGTIPGTAGVSAQVAAKAKEGVEALVAFMEQRRSADVARWCCDAIHTLVRGDAEQLALAHRAGALALVLRRVKEGVWEENLQVAGLSALLSFAPTYAAEIGALDGVRIVTVSMYRNKTNHSVQVIGVRLLSMLVSMDDSGANLERAREVHAARIVQSILKAHSTDGVLEFKGIGLIEMLEPGSAAGAGLASSGAREESLRTQEQVVRARSFARLDSKLSLSQLLAASASGSSTDFRGGGGSSFLHLMGDVLRERRNEDEEEEEDDEDEESFAVVGDQDSAVLFSSRHSDTSGPSAQHRRGSQEDRHSSANNSSQRRGSQAEPEADHQPPPHPHSHAADSHAADSHTGDADTGPHTGVKRPPLHLRLPPAPSDAGGESSGYQESPLSAGPTPITAYSALEAQSSRSHDGTGPSVSVQQEGASSHEESNAVVRILPLDDLRGPEAGTGAEAEAEAGVGADPRTSPNNDKGDTAPLPMVIPGHVPDRDAVS
jgi:hypothetical protein